MRKGAREEREEEGGGEGGSICGPQKGSPPESEICVARRTRVTIFDPPPRGREVEVGGRWQDLEGTILFKAFSSSYPTGATQGPISSQQTTWVIIYTSFLTI